MVTFKDIIEDNNKYPLIQTEKSWNSPIHYISEAIANFVNESYIEIPEKDYNRFAYKKVHDESFDSDEESTVIIFFFDGKACFTYTKFGDRNGYDVYIINRKVYETLLIYLRSLINDNIEEDFDVNAKVVDYLNKGAMYNTFIEIGGDVYYNFKSPYWSHSFGKGLKGYYLNEDDTLTECEIVDLDFKRNDNNNYKVDKFYCYIMLDGKKTKVETIRILVKI